VNDKPLTFDRVANRLFMMFCQNQGTELDSWYRDALTFYVIDNDFSDLAEIVTAHSGQ